MRKNKFYNVRRLEHTDGGHGFYAAAKMKIYAE